MTTPTARYATWGWGRSVAAMGATALALLQFGCATPAGPVRGDRVGSAIQRVEITSRESPAFEGRAFGTVGQYEKLRGTVHAEIDPLDARHAGITDLQLAARNARGKVDYSYDFYIVRPVDASKGNRKLFYEVSNRGRLLAGPMNGGKVMDDPKTVADIGEGFLLQQGYTLASSGWDFTAPATGHSLKANLPVVSNADGSPITGPVYESFSPENTTTTTATLIYAPASRDPAQARLTVKAHLTDAPTQVPAGKWEYAGDRAIRLLPAGTPFAQGRIYELSYTARDPVVAGVAFPLVRDFVAFLRHGRADAAGNANPLAGRIERTLAYSVSQPARFMNDFVWMGFNEDAGGGRVFDGVHNWIGAGTGVAANVRFALPLKTERNRKDKLHPEAVFPFAYTAVRDAVTGKVDGRLLRCQRSDTCPRILNVNSSNEYWVKAGSLLHTDTEGRDLGDAAGVRSYLLSSVEHTGGTGSPPTAGICATTRNTVDPSPALRALFVALDQWLDGIEPPASRVPRLGDGTAVMIRQTADQGFSLGAVSQAELGWPSIPGIHYSGLATVRTLMDFGPRAHQGILDLYPPRVTASVYPAFVPKVDADGNDIAGIRLPPVAAPVATYTGWGHRATAHGGPDGCEQFGQTIAFAATRAQRDATGDPRPSLAERYPTRQHFVDAVARAARTLERDRLLLPDDVARYIEAAQGRALGE